MNEQSGKGRRFQELHAAGTFLMPNPSDAGTAWLLERAGFPALATSSAGYAFSLGKRDGEVSRDLMMEHVRQICAATTLPVSADLGDGFGRFPEDVADAIRNVAAAGAVGASIEDSTGDPNDPLLELALATERIVAAVETARSLGFPFTLTARAENFMTGSLDLGDVLRRLDAYRLAGADVLYAPGISDCGAIRDVVTLAGVTPVNVLALGAWPCSDAAELARLGVRRISLGSALARVAVTATRRAIEQLAEARLGFLESIDPLEHVNSLFPPGKPSQGG